MAGTAPSDADTADSTIDSVNAFTPYPEIGTWRRSVARSASARSMPSGTYGPTSSTKRVSTARNESSLCHSVSSASNPITSKRFIGATHRWIAFR